MEITSDIRISVILSTYNDEKYIAEAIESVLNQTYKHFEFIIVDDGSTDNTNRIIKSFDDERIVLVEKKNTGLINSLNYGFSVSKYNWVIRMDGDDICYPNRFEMLMSRISDNVAVIGSNCTLIDSSGKIIGRTKNPLTTKGIIRNLLLMLPSVFHSSTLINKEIFNETAGYDKLMHVAEDYDLWLRMSLKGEIINVEDELMYYRMHESNISKKKAEIQLLNSQIAFVKYINGKSGLINVQDYSIIKNVLEKKYIYKLYIKSGIKSKNKDNGKMSTLLFLSFNVLLKIWLLLTQRNIIR